MTQKWVQTGKYKYAADYTWSHEDITSIQWVAIPKVWESLLHQRVSIFTMDIHYLLYSIMCLIPGSVGPLNMIFVLLSQLISIDIFWARKRTKLDLARHDAPAGSKFTLHG